MAQKNELEKLTVRQILVIRLILFVIKVINPSEWVDEFKKENEAIHKSLDKFS